MSVPELRPRTASELVDATFQLTRAHYVPLLVLSAIMTAPSLVISVLAAQVIRGMTTIGPGGTFGAGTDLGPRLATWGALVLAGLWYFVIDGALVWFAAQALLGHPTEPGVALRRAFGRAGRLIGSNIVRLLYIGLGMIIPFGAIAVMGAMLGTSGARRNDVGTIALLGFGVLAAMVLMLGWLLFVFARYIVAAPVLMLEDRGAIASLTRAAELMVGARRKTAVILVLAFVVYFALSLLASAPVGGFMRPTAASIVVRSLVQVLLYPLFASLVTLIYYDRRVKKEALDIELMSGSLGAAQGVDAA